MGQWFPTLDAAAGGTADVVGDTGGWVLGGIGSTIGNTVEGAGSVVGETTAGLFAPLFRGLGRWLLLAGIVVGATVVLGRWA